MSAATAVQRLLGWIHDHINQGFHWTPGNTKLHSGIDYNVSYGTALGTPLAGKIVHSGWEPWGGQVDEMVNVGGVNYILSWLHLSDTSAVYAGETVQAGQYIGKSGAPPSPKYGNGPHLHFEVTHGTQPPYIGYSPWHPTASSYPVDPVGFLGGTGSNSSSGGSGTGTSTVTPTSFNGGIPGIQGVVDAINNFTKSFQGIATFSTDWLANPWRIIKLVAGLGIIGLTIWAALNIKSVQVATNVVEGVAGVGNPVNRFARVGGTARGLGARPPQVFAPSTTTQTAPTQPAPPLGNPVNNPANFTRRGAGTRGGRNYHGPVPRGARPYNPNAPQGQVP